MLYNIDIDILSYKKFRETREYKCYCRDLIANMHRLGYSCISMGVEMEKSERSSEHVLQSLTARGITSGKAVWERRQGDCGLYYLTIFYKDW